jgi:hypothetical protein
MADHVKSKPGDVVEMMASAYADQTQNQTAPTKVTCARDQAGQASLAQYSLAGTRPTPCWWPPWDGGVQTTLEGWDQTEDGGVLVPGAG